MLCSYTVISRRNFNWNWYFVIAIIEPQKCQLPNSARGLSIGKLAFPFRVRKSREKNGGAHAYDAMTVTA